MSDLEQWLTEYKATAHPRRATRLAARRKLRAASLREPRVTVSVFALLFGVEAAARWEEQKASRRSLLTAHAHIRPCDDAASKAVTP